LTTSEREIEFALRVRQGNVDDRGVEQHHQLRDAE
jgi:hypothetical protein